VLKSGKQWYIRPPDGSLHVYVGKSTQMQNFMWADSADQYWWLNGNILELRNLDGSRDANQDLFLPDLVDMVSVMWLSGSGSGETKQVVYGWDQADDSYFYQAFSRDGLQENFWLKDVT